ncbi:MAG: hypothetical protein H0V81_17220 [Solirubrobacterales bacterium]|nr:hypothetical protein [Solirubrobacterales bacterium]
MRRGGGEDGIALLATMVVLVLMLSFGLSLLKIVDTQTDASGAQRQRDSTFNLAESALSAQVFSLARDWPGAGHSATPYTSCTQATATIRCPVGSQLIAGAAPDVQSGATWETSVHDNDAAGGTQFYSDALIRSRPGYDANGDGRLWVRARATAKARTRTLVALVGAELQEESIPQAALIGGKVEITNEGNKTLIAANGGLLAVRCTPQLLDLVPCLGHTFGSGKNSTLTELLNNLATQISGTTPTTGYTGTAGLSAEAQARLRATAIADGTYYATCPPVEALTGHIVWIESGNCTYSSNTVMNSAAKPGVLVLGSATITFGGSSKFYGVIYALNSANSTGWAVSTQGNSALITGGVIIDGAAGMSVGSSGLNIFFDPNAFRAVSSYGSAGVVQNTWREIQSG